jgi:hypothetical protein
MVRKLIITEDDRRNILSMYNLLTEADKVQVTINGTVTSPPKTDYNYNVKVTLLNSDGEKISQTLTDFDGNFKMEDLELEKGSYSLNYNNGIYNIEYSENITITKSETKTVTAYLKPAQELDVVTVQAKSLIRGKVVTNKNPDGLSGCTVVAYEFGNKVDQTITDVSGNFKIKYEKDVLENLNIKFFGGNDYIDKEIIPTQRDLGEIFLEKRLFAVEGSVYTNDENNKSFINGLTVNIYRNSEKINTTKVDKNGNFYFRNLDSLSNLTVTIVGGGYFSDKTVIVSSGNLGKIQLLSIYKPVEPVEKDYIDFRDIDFEVAVKESYTTGKDIFLLFGLDGNEPTEKVLSVLESDKDRVNNINNNYIPLYYQVNRLDTNKYMSASEPLGVRTYPAITIVRAINNPDENYIIDSIKTIKMQSRIADNLDNINTLFD